MNFYLFFFHKIFLRIATLLGNILASNSVWLECHLCAKHMNVDKEVYKRNGPDYEYFCSMSCRNRHGNLVSSRDPDAQKYCERELALCADRAKIQADKWRQQFVDVATPTSTPTTTATAATTSSVSTS